MKITFLTMEEQTTIIEYFGDYPLIRVLHFLILSRELDYSMTEIAKNSGVGWTAFSEIWSSLIKKEIVIFTRKIGNAKLFKLNNYSKQFFIFVLIHSIHYLLEFFVLFIIFPSCYTVELYAHEHVV